MLKIEWKIKNVFILSFTLPGRSDTILCKLTFPPRCSWCSAGCRSSFPRSPCLAGLGWVSDVEREQIILSFFLLKGMTTLLTLTAMFSSVRQNVPRVSYISYLDIWMLTCMIFVFSCIMEFIVVTALTKFGHKKHGERVSLCDLKAEQILVLQTFYIF